MSHQIAIQDIPESLIYEMVDGEPIYYKGYLDVLKGNKHLEEIRSDSTMQAWLKIQLGTILTNILGEKYVTTGGEQGLYFRKKSWRAADLAIFSFDNFELNNHYAKKAPEVVIEIDTKADLENIGDFIGYFDEKNQQLLAFGVKKIIWIFTDSEKINVITNTQGREVLEWSDDIPVIDDCTINIQTIFDKAPFNKK